jgi:hypothetical protein
MDNWSAAISWHLLQELIAICNTKKKKTSSPDSPSCWETHQSHLQSAASWSCYRGYRNQGDHGLGTILAVCYPLCFWYPISKTQKHHCISNRWKKITIFHIQHWSKYTSGLALFSTLNTLHRISIVHSSTHADFHFTIKLTLNNKLLRNMEVTLV